MPSPSTSVAHVRHQRPLMTGNFAVSPTYGVSRDGGTDDWLLCATMAGQGIIGFDDRTYTTIRGDVLLLAPRQAHAYRVDPMLNQWHFVWCHFLPPAHVATYVTWPTIIPHVGRLHIPDPAFQPILDELQRMHAWAASERHHRDALALNALEAALLLIDEFHPHSPAARDGHLDHRLRLVCERVSQDLRYPWDVATMAELVAWSPSRFAHCFRAALGETPRAFVERLRMDRARNLLSATGLSINEIAEQIGFADPFHFSNRFRSIVGQAPTRYRKQQVDG